MNNGKEVVEFVRSQKLSRDETILSFDVVSLFTSIPVTLALDVVKRKLSEYGTWKTHTNLQQNQIIKLLKFVLNKFNGTYFHQVLGCAMGSPVSAVIAGLSCKRLNLLPSVPRHVRFGGGVVTSMIQTHAYESKTSKNFIPI